MCVYRFEIHLIFVPQSDFESDVYIDNIRADFRRTSEIRADFIVVSIALKVRL